MNAQSLLMSAAYYMEDVSDPVSTLLWIGLAILVALILVVVFLRFVPLACGLPRWRRAYTSASVPW